MIDLRNGDCLEVLKTIPDNSIDLIITSPPYNLSHKKRNCGGCLIKYNSYSDDLNYDDYIKWQVDVLNECFRVLKDTGLLYYNHKERHIKGYYFNPLHIIEKTKFNVLQTIIWDRSSGMTFNIGRFVNCYETITVAYKSNKYMRINKEYEKMFDVWHFLPERRPYQIASFPMELPSRIIQAYDNQKELTILDPFMGSGTTGVASKKFNRNFIGIEIDKIYFENAKNRIDSYNLDEKKY